ncbi:MAG: NADP-dependent oxidoreductase [Candidatus Dormibacteria bacterium]
MITTALNRQVRLAARPTGVPTPDVWSFTQEPVPEPADGQALVRVHYVSLDPAMRGWMNEARSYAPPVGIGEVMRAGAVGEVVASRTPELSQGDFVTGMFGVQQYAVTGAAGAMKVDPSLAPLPTYLGTLGMPGLTAYFGLLEVGQMQAGDTVVISAAAGAVGSVAGQIAKAHGCRVVGIAGGPEKCTYLVSELGFDSAIDYRNENVAQALREHCPDRINVYFDNVGGEILDAALTRLARGARIVICGAISQYNNTTPAPGPANYMALLVDRATMRGFLVFDYMDRYGEAITKMAGWYREGKLRSREDVVDGIDNFPDALLRLFRGDNRGKQVLKVGGD